MCRTRMSVTSVIAGNRLPTRIRSPRKNSGKGIRPGARTDAGLAAIQAGVVRIGATGAEVGAAGAVATKAAYVLGERGESVLHPALPDVLKALGVRGATAHAIKILG